MRPLAARARCSPSIRRRGSTSPAARVPRRWSTADVTVTFHRAKAGFALDREARRLAGRYLVAPIGIPLEAEEGIVPPDGELPPARITEINWQEPVERADAAHRPGRRHRRRSRPHGLTAAEPEGDETR